MPFRSFSIVLLEAGLVTALVVGSFLVVQAEVRTSPSYQLQSDSINFSGGLSTSSNYALESTAGEVATGNSDSASYSLRAGYQQMQEVFLSMTAPADVVMSPNLGGITGGVANGTTNVVITTDGPAGYELTISAENSPAMQMGAESIANYVTDASPEADYTFTTDPTEAYFGFSPEGNDIDDRYRDNGAACGVGVLDTSLACWDAVVTTPVVIASGPANQPLGATTTLRFRVEIGNAAPVLAGTYIATTTLTAVAL